MLANEAEHALAEVALGRRRAQEHKGYAAAGSVLILWGIVWFVANLISQFLPYLAGLAWSTGIVIATVWTVTRPRHVDDGRILGTWLVIAVYLGITLAIVGADVRLADFLISLMVGATYLIVGIWAGLRFALLGATLVAVALIAWIAAPDFLFVLLAIGGGGTLIVGGLWLRRA
jgi:hypothetical protein